MDSGWAQEQDAVVSLPRGTWTGDTETMTDAASVIERGTGGAEPAATQSLRVCCLGAWEASTRHSFAGSLGWGQEENQGRAVQAGGLTAPRELSTLLEPPQAA